jgi:hypothetical protein
MRVTLEVHSGPQAGRFITVPAGTEVIVGRKAPAHFLIEGDLTLSRAHFALTCDPPRCLIRDLGSTAGTFLNGEPITQAEVQQGDIIEAGSTFLIVRIDARTPTTSEFMPSRPAIDINLDRDGPPTEEIQAVDDESILDQVLKHLRSQNEPLFAILDAARDPLVFICLMNCNEQYQSLYEGMKGERLAAAAPYLVSLPPRSLFLETLVREGWGNSWGIYLTCPEPFEAVREHLRRFLTVKTEAGRELLFRYYDPRVLRVFLPGCLPEELAAFFGSISQVSLEGPSPEILLRFRLESGRLVDRGTRLAQIAR